MPFALHAAVEADEKQSLKMRFDWLPHKWKKRLLDDGIACHINILLKDHYRLHRELTLKSHGVPVKLHLVAKQDVP